MRYVLGLALGLSLAAAGCSRSTGTVSGKVYYKNTPLKGGNVTFLAPDKKISKVAEIKEDGSYEIDKMPAGEAAIAVDTSTMKPPATRTPVKNAPPKGKQPPPGYTMANFGDKAKRYVPIPPQYASPEKSGLIYTVQGGKQAHDINLQ